MYVEFRGGDSEVVNIIYLPTLKHGSDVVDLETGDLANLYPCVAGFEDKRGSGAGEG
jgi:hypothetical protein